jgi:5'-nucleotidase / UDP-sugar diphosphatase
LLKKLLFFLILTSILVILSGSGLACQSGSSLTKLTVLHTNDTHSNLDNVGRRATVIQQLRDQAGKDNVLLVDAGDVFMGTLYFTLTQGQADLWFMHRLGYEAMGLGNHEFDKGPSVLADFVDKSGFPVLCSNFDFSKEPALAGKIKPWTVIQKNGEKYGLFALTTEDTAQLSSPGNNIVINDHILSAQQAVAELQKQGVNKIIALTQIGWDKDLELASKVKDIDVIVGGHTEIVPDNYPAVFINFGSPTLIVQAGSQGQYLGQLNVNFDRDGVIKNWDGSRLVTIDQKIQADAACTSKLEEYQKPIKDMLQNIVGKTLVDLDGDRTRIRTGETNLAGLVTDAMLESARPLGATIAFLNAGSIRSSIAAGDISLGQIKEVQPYGNFLVVIRINGQQIISALENGLSQVEESAGRFPHVSGLRYTWNPRAPSGSRIVSVEINNGNTFQPLDAAAQYRVVTNNFMAGGGDGYAAFKESAKTESTGLTDFDVLQVYIKTHSPLNPVIEGRIKQVSP